MLRGMPTRLTVSLGAALLCACGSMPMSTDAGADAGRVITPPMDAGTDAGFVEVDAGPRQRAVFGDMTVNGAPHELKSGYVGMATTLQFNLGTDDTVSPRLLVRLILPGDAGAGFTAPCNTMPGNGPVVLFVAQQIVEDAGTAYFTLNPTCTVSLSQVAAMQGETYIGTFSGSAELDPRSVLDAGYGTFTVTNGSFTVTREF